MENTTFELLTEFQYSSEALIVKGKLESEGIEVFLRDQFTVDANPVWSNAVGGVKLYVSTVDFARAKSVLDGIGKFSVDDQGHAITCPECAATKVELVTTVKDRKSFWSFVFSILLFGILPFYVKYTYRCLACHFEFTAKGES